LPIFAIDRGQLNIAQPGHRSESPVKGSARVFDFHRDKFEIEIFGS
jgi:hypothetical protein